MNRTDWRASLVLALAMLLSAVLYAPGLSGPFIYDDAYNLAPVLEWHRDLLPWQDVVLGNQSGPLGRPLSMLSFLATGMVSGVEPFHFKLGNLVLHLATGLLAWGVLRRVMRLDPRLASQADLLAACAAGLWLLHPMHASTVLYAVQRMAQLGGFFTLAVLLAYLHARHSLETGERGRGLRVLFVMTPLLLALGLLGKENAAIAPMLCLLVEAIHPAQSRQAARPLRGFLLVAAVIPAVILATVMLASPARLLGRFANRDFSLGERLLTQARALLDYLGQILAPRGDRMTVYTDGYAHSTGLWSPPETAIAIAALAAVTVAAWWLRKRLPLVAFGWGFFLLGHAIESSILPLDLYYDHRNYLPMIGLSAALVGLAWSCANARLAPRHAVITTTSAALVCAVLLGFGLADRAHAWQSRERLLAEALQHHPDSLRAQLAQVDADRAEGRIEAARRRLQPLETNPSTRTRLLARLEGITVACRNGDPVHAEDIEAAVRERPDRIGTNEIQSVTLLLQRTHSGQCGDFDDLALGHALAELAASTPRQSDRSGPRRQIRHAAAIAFARSGHPEEAMTQAKLAWDSGAGLDVGFLLAWSQLQLGDRDGATRTLAEMEQRLPRFNRKAEREIEKTRIALRRSAMDQADGRSDTPL